MALSPYRKSNVALEPVSRVDPDALEEERLRGIERDANWNLLFGWLLGLAAIAVAIVTGRFYFGLGLVFAGRLHIRAHNEKRRVAAIRKQRSEERAAPARLESERRARRERHLARLARAALEAGKKKPQ